MELLDLGKRFNEPSVLDEFPMTAGPFKCHSTLLPFYGCFMKLQFFRHFLNITLITLQSCLAEFHSKFPNISNLVAIKSNDKEQTASVSVIHKPQINRKCKFRDVLSGVKQVVHNCGFNIAGYRFCCLALCRTTTQRVDTRAY